MLNCEEEITLGFRNKSTEIADNLEKLQKLKMKEIITLSLIKYCLYGKDKVENLVVWDEEEK